MEMRILEADTQFTSEDIKYMKAALKQAEKAIAILESCGEKASVIGRVTDQPGVNIVLK